VSGEIRTFVTPLIEAWQETRRQLAEIERVEHPDVTDGYGRVWRWRGRGDLYVHDDTLAFPLDVIPHLSLPSPSLEQNPNYFKLCGTCRQGWVVMPLFDLPPAEVPGSRWGRM
jgi:hypothetical protein